ncbi:hypothetical protein D3C86_2072030 [compost metagenome]
MINLLVKPCAEAGGDVATGGKSQYANTLRIEFPLLRIRTDNTHRTLDVGERGVSAFLMPVARHAVRHHK